MKSLACLHLALVLILSNSGCTLLVRSNSGKEVASNTVTKNLNEGKVSCTQILKLGSKGEQVVKLKNRLFNFNYLTDYKSDGIFSFSNIFNAETEKAVKEFQKDNNLKNDGIVGVKTNEALEAFFVTKWLLRLSGRALFNRGLEQNNFSDALQDYNEAIKQDKNLAEAYYSRGMLYDYTTALTGIDRDINKASNNFSEAIKRNPDYVETYLERGIIHDEKKDWIMAVQKVYPPQSPDTMGNESGGSDPAEPKSNTNSNEPCNCSSKKHQ